MLWKVDSPGVFHMRHSYELSIPKLLPLCMIVTLVDLGLVGEMGRWAPDCTMSRRLWTASCMFLTVCGASALPLS